MVVLVSCSSLVVICFFKAQLGLGGFKPHTLYHKDTCMSTELCFGKLLFVREIENTLLIPCRENDVIYAFNIKVPDKLCSYVCVYIYICLSN